MNNSIASQGNFSTQNGNDHKCLLVINRVDNMIHSSSKALANNM